MARKLVEYELATHHAPSSNRAMYQAAVFAKRYALKIPTHHDIMRDFGMSRANAYRWVSAMRDAGWTERAR